MSVDDDDAANDHEPAGKQQQDRASKKRKGNWEQDFQQFQAPLQTDPRLTSMLLAWCDKVPTLAFQDGPRGPPPISFPVRDGYHFWLL